MKTTIFLMAEIGLRVSMRMVLVGQDTSETTTVRNAAHNYMSDRDDDGNLISEEATNDRCPYCDTPRDELDSFEEHVFETCNGRPARLNL